RRSSRSTGAPEKGLHPIHKRLGSGPSETCVPQGGWQGQRRGLLTGQRELVSTLTAIPAGLAAGFLIAVVTTPAGVSGAVFLLPVQLSVLDVPSPSVTPTNLLFNVVAVPGALARFRR